MQAKVFDPFSEDAVNAWLATTPVKVIYSANVFDTTLDGHARRVALVFYEDEQEIRAQSASGVRAPANPLAELLGEVFQPEPGSRTVEQQGGRSSGRMNPPSVAVRSTEWRRR